MRNMKNLLLVILSEPPSPVINPADLVNIDESSLDASVEAKTPGKRRRLGLDNHSFLTEFSIDIFRCFSSSSERTPMKLRPVSSLLFSSHPYSSIFLEDSLAKCGLSIQYQQ